MRVASESLERTGDPRSFGNDDEYAEYVCRTQVGTHDMLDLTVTTGDTSPDYGKQRVTVGLYTALIGEDVEAHLEGIVRVRKETHPRAYQTDEKIHQSFMATTTAE